jgi:excisionase family DNA binding protein
LIYVDGAIVVLYTAGMQEIDGALYLTAEEAIALLGVKRATLYAYVSRGVLSSYRKGVGRERLYRRAEIDALLNIRPDTAEPRRIAERPATYAAPPDDGTMRDVTLPDVETWAGDH